MLPSFWACRASRSQVLSRHRFLLAAHKRLSSTKSRFLKVSGEVQQAIAEHRPVIALETTVYTHGYPYPENLSLSSRLESLVRTHGAVPATIGILDGVARVGLGADELVRLLSSSGRSEPLKISRRDLGFALGLKDPTGQPYNGGTTIAGTMVLAHMAGIKVFATGGLGGVHRGAETTMDVSADLTELGRTPVAVISSGCKAFLDLPKTLEFLETQGVAVATFADGRGDRVDFPAFWTRESGVPSPYTLKDELDAARVLHAHFSLGLQSGLHFANPIPEHHSLSLEVMEGAIYEAIKLANVSGAVGAAATPYILTKIRDITGNESVAANKALLEANVIRGAKVAKQLNILEKEGSTVQDSHQPDSATMPNFPRPSFSSVQSIRKETPPQSKEPPASTPPQLEEDVKKPMKPAKKPNVFVAGSVAIDLSCDYIKPTALKSTTEASQPALHTSNPARISQSLGGVAGNIARAAHALGARVQLCSAIGDDVGGQTAIEALKSFSLSTDGIQKLSDARTGQYVAINDSKKDLMLGMADMDILESTATGPGTLHDTFDTLWLPQLREARLSHLVLDPCWAPEHLGRWIDAGKGVNAHVSFEPVSNAKAARLFRIPKPHTLSVFPKPSVHLTTPNASELAAMYAAAREGGFFDRADWWQVIDALGIPSTGARTQLALATSNELVDRGIPQQSIQLLPFIPSICTTLGAQGVLLTEIIPAGDSRLSSGHEAPHILARCNNETQETLGVGGVYMRLYPPSEELSADDVVSVKGAGDTFLGTLIAGLAEKKGARIDEYIDVAQMAASTALKCEESVPPGLSVLRLFMNSESWTRAGR